MSGMCGWATCGSVQYGRHEVIQRMTATLARFDQRAIKSQDGEGWALGYTYTGPAVDLYQDTDVIVALSGHPRLRASFDHSTQLANSSVAGTLGRAFVERGAACLQLIEGDFAAAIVAK